MKILLFTGLSGSGKTTIARKIGNELELPVISTRGLLHAAATQKGFARIRYWLAEAGFDDILREGREKMAEAIEEEKKRGEKGVIVDDIFDPEMLAALSQRFPNEKIQLIYTETSREIREERMIVRIDADREEAIKELTFLDGVKAEAGIAEVIQAAEIKIENSGELGETLNELRRELGFTLCPQGVERDY